MKNNSLLKNTIYNSIYNGLNIIFPLVTIPYLSRVLLAEGLGIVNYSRNIVGWFLLFASLGIPRYGIREIAKNKQKEENLNKVFSELFCFNLISTFLCSVIFIFTVYNTGIFSEYEKLYFVTGIQLFLNIINVDWFYQGIEEYEYITKRSIVVKLVSLILMFIFVKNQNDYIVYALIQSVAVAGNYFFNFFNLRKHVRITFKSLNIIQHAKPILVLLSTQLAVSVYSMLDTTMLGIWCDNQVVGYYTNVHKVINTISVMTASISGVLLPRLVGYYNNNEFNKVSEISRRTLDIIITACLPISIGVYVLSPQIVRIVFGHDFLPCITTLKIFAPFILITSIGNLFGTQLLMTFNKEKYLLSTVSLGALMNLILNAFLIPIYRQDGAAISSVITELFVLLIQIYYVNQTLSVKTTFKFVKSIVLINLIELLYLLLVSCVFDRDSIIVIIGIIGAIVLYLLSGIVSKNDSIIFFIELVRSKLWRSKKI